jgi:hypothetical protein
MCELCLHEARIICEPIGNWSLVSVFNDSLCVRKGDFGLVDPCYSSLNIVIPREVMPTGPHMTWPEIVELDFSKMSEIERARINKLMSQVERFGKEVLARADSISTIAELAVACEKEGWNPEKEYFEYWLSARLGKLMKGVSSV